MLETGEEVRERFHAMLNTRIENDFELRDLFGSVPKTKAINRKLLEALFEQTPAAMVMAPSLQPDYQVEEQSCAVEPEPLVNKGGYKVPKPMTPTSIGSPPKMKKVSSASIWRGVVKRAAAEYTKTAEMRAVPNHWEGDGDGFHEAIEVLTGKRPITTRTGGKAKIARELTEAARDKIKTKNFAIPEKEKYPIHDEAHARNALARVSQHGSAEEKARVRTAVARKHPGVVGEETKEDLSQMKKTSAVDAFFAAHGQFRTEAQRRFPELVKVAADPSKLPNLRKAKATTKLRGAIPVQSSLSNGSA
jgi:hypothetical protein